MFNKQKGTLYSCQIPVLAHDGLCVWTVESSTRNVHQILGSTIYLELATYRKTLIASLIPAEIYLVALDWHHLPIIAANSFSVTILKNFHPARAKKVWHLTPLLDAAFVVKKSLAFLAPLWDLIHKESRRRFHNHLAECKLNVQLSNKRYQQRIVV